MTGEVITITLDEEVKIKRDLMDGVGWIQVQGNLINAKSVSKVGVHHATEYVNRLEKSQEKTDVKIADSKIILIGDEYKKSLVQT